MVMDTHHVILNMFQNLSAENRRIRRAVRN